MTENKVQAAKNLFAQGMLPKDVAQNLEISVPTLYRWIPASEQIKLIVGWGKGGLRELVGFVKK